MTAITAYKQASLQSAPKNGWLHITPCRGNAIHPYVKHLFTCDINYGYTGNSVESYGNFMIRTLTYLPGKKHPYEKWKRTGRLLYQENKRACKKEPILDNKWDQNHTAEVGVDNISDYIWLAAYRASVMMHITDRKLSYINALSDIYGSAETADKTIGHLYFLIGSKLWAIKKRTQLRKHMEYDFSWATDTFGRITEIIKELAAQSESFI